VKSTKFSIERTDQTPMFITSQQWNFVQQSEEDQIYCLARVFDAWALNTQHPKVFYFTLTSELEL
jgi:hypothetical protein